MIEPCTIRVHGLAHGGEGVGRDVDGDGPTWLIEGTSIGDLVSAEASHRARRWTRGQVLTVLEAGPDRVAPPCAYASACGGCGWQHIRADLQAEHKRAIAVGQMRAVQVEWAPLVANPRSLHYRRRARLHYTREGAQLRLGFHARRSREVVDIDRCIVLEAPLDAAIQRIRSFAQWLPDRGEVLALTDGSRVVLGLPGVRVEPEFVEALERALDDVLVGVSLRGWRTRKVIGRAQLEIDGGQGLPPVRSGPFSFAQADAAQNRMLVDAVVQAASVRGRTVLELHAGSGNFTRALARGAQLLVAVDEDAEALDELRGLVAREGLPVRVRKGRVEAVLAKSVERGERFSVVVLDPPRDGLGAEASAQLADVATDCIVYVSCDPATLARDLQVLSGKGFSQIRVQTFDMMPMTPEIECMAVLRRGPRS